MINSIILGLNALAAITGISSRTNFEVTREDYINIAETIKSSVSYGDKLLISNVIAYDDIYYIYGENRYLCVELKNAGYLIYDKRENCVIEYNPYELNPYKNYDDGVLKLLYHYDDKSYYFIYENDDFEFINDTLNLNLNICNDLINESTDDSGYYYTNVNPSNDAVFINNSYYFEKLGNNHGLNDSGICTIIATQIILGYYDTFNNDNLVDEKYDVISIEKTDTKSIKNFSQSPGTGNAYSDQRFRDYLVNLTTNVIGVSPVNRGMYTKEQITLVNKYLIDSNLSYSLSTSEGNWGDQITNRAITIIKNAIDNNRPVLVNGSGHSTVAYGYDDNYVYVHTGWGYVAATPWSTFTTKWLNNEFDTGAVDILLGDEHYHSDNYYSEFYNEYYCPDGYKYENLTLYPDEYNFESQYFFYEKTSNISKNGYLINTKRLRTGYIENEYINLSSRRENAGIAYLEFYCPFFIRKIDLDISFWSSNELYLFDGNCALIQYMDLNANWITIFDLLNDVTLSTNRNNQNKLTVKFPKDVSNFRIYAENNPIGDRNKGRISIKRLEITHA